MDIGTVRKEFHANKAYMRSEGIDLHIPDLDTTKRRMVSVAFFVVENSPWHPLDWKLGMTAICFGHDGKEKNPSMS